jgi:hypothetical protein
MRFLVATFISALSLCALASSSPAQFPQSPKSRDACRLESDGRATGPGADICENLARRWALLLPAPPSPGVIRIVKREGYGGMGSPGGWILEVPMPEPHPGDSKYRASDGLLRYYADDVIPHEAGHQLFMILFGRSGATVNADQYGSPAPDWIDEAPAVWMESRSHRQGRMKPVLRTKPSLAALVTMAHPNSGFVHDRSPGPDSYNFQRTVIPPCAKCTWLPDSLRKRYRVIDYRADGRGRTDTIVWYSARNPTRHDTIEEREFYPLSYSLLRFIRVRGGTAAVNEIIARYREDPTPRVAVFASLPGLPASVAAFETAWHEFLNRPPPEDR